MEWLHFLVYQLWWLSDLKHASLHTKVPPWFDADFQTWAARVSLLIKQERSVFFISFQHFFTPAKWMDPYIHMPLLSQFHGILVVQLRQDQSSGPRCHPCALRLAPLRVQVSSASLGRLDQAYHRWSASIDLNIIYICVCVYIDIVIGKWGRVLDHVKSASIVQSSNSWGPCLLDLQKTFLGCLCGIAREHQNYSL
jgi:hypothetical protein